MDSSRSQHVPSGDQARLKTGSVPCSNRTSCPCRSQNLTSPAREAPARSALSGDQARQVTAAPPSARVANFAPSAPSNWRAAAVPHWRPPATGRRGRPRRSRVQQRQLAPTTSAYSRGRSDEAGEGRPLTAKRGRRTALSARCDWAARAKTRRRGQGSRRRHRRGRRRCRRRRRCRLCPRAATSEDKRRVADFIDRALAPTTPARATPGPAIGRIYH